MELGSAISDILYHSLPLKPLQCLSYVFSESRYPGQNNIVLTLHQTIELWVCQN